MKKYIILGFFCMLGVFSSCDSMFEREVPPHTMVGENAITNETTAEIALNGIYSYMEPFGTMDAIYIRDSECRLKLFDDATGVDAFEKDALMYGQAKEEDVRVKDPWVTYFRLINAANNFIYQVERLSESQFGPNRKTEMLAEARFMRAFGHAQILRYYGYFWDIDSKYGALLRLEPSSLSNSNMPRSTVRESYERIFEDYDYAIEYGPKFYSRYRSCATLARAFKAELLLSRGESGDYREAIALADSVLASSEFEMEPDYASIFKNGFDSKELMWTRWYEDAATSTNIARVYFNFGEGIYKPSELYFGYFPEDDARFRVALDTVTFTDQTGKTRDKLVFLKHYKTDKHTPMYYMRLAQMYLIKAEALAYSGASGQDVLDVLNVLRTRSGNSLLEITDFGSHDKLLEEIFAEYVREIGTENNALYPVALRMDLGGGVRLIQQINSTYQNLEWLCFPIPKDEMEHNFDIEQKPL